MTERTAVALCSRCSGKMLHDHLTDDWVCFNCGHVAYTQAVIAIPNDEKRRSRASSGGYRLD